MDAYSWCLEYPQTIQRLYPTAGVSADHPPRILFIVERLTDLFCRRLKALGVGDVDCVEFRHLEVNGTPALYFDPVRHVRRSEQGSPVDERETTPSARGSSPTSPSAVQGVPVLTTAPEPSSSITNDVTVPREVTAAPEPERIDAPVSALSTSAESSVQDGAPRRDPVALLQQRLGELVAAQAADACGSSGPAIANGATPDDLAFKLESAEEAARRAAAALGAMTDRVRQNPEWQALLNSLGVDSQAPTPSLVEPVTAVGPEVPDVPDLPEPEPLTPIEPVAEAAASPEMVEEESNTPTTAEAEASDPLPVETKSPPAWAKSTDPGAVSTGGSRGYFFVQAGKSEMPEAPQPVQEPKAETAPESEPRPELDAMSFPKDGLSRQWLEFIHQLGGIK